MRGVKSEEKYICIVELSIPIGMRALFLGGVECGNSMGLWKVPEGCFVRGKEVNLIISSLVFRQEERSVFSPGACTSSLEPLNQLGYGVRGEGKPLCH